jgi:hypothetical protein
LPRERIGAGAGAATSEEGMTRYWVVGGEYQSTNFRELSPGAAEERHGPFDSYEAARKKWAERAMATVDSATARFRIEEDSSAEYWVVGGSFADARFESLAPGETEERYGPFRSEDQAYAKWRERSMATEEDPLARYRIERV